MSAVRPQVALATYRKYLVALWPETDEKLTHEEDQAIRARAYALLNRAERRALGDRGHRFGLGTLASSIKQARR